MCEDCGKHRQKSDETSATSDMSRRDFVTNVVVGTAAGSMLFRVNEPAVASTITARTNPTDCYKRLFNSLNQSDSHFAPPDGEDTEGSKFAPVMMFFKAFFNNPTNKTLIHNEFKPFEKFYLDLCRRSSNDILAMIFTCSGDEKHKKTPAAIHRDFQAAYPAYSKVSEDDIKRTLDGFFVKFGLIATDEKATNYWSYPFVFGMGDKNYAILIGTCFADGDTNKTWGKQFWKKVEQYMLDPTKGSMVYQSWNPPKYRTVPAQIASPGTPGADLFAEYVNDKLHPFDRLDSIVEANDITVWYPYQCGCMKLKLQKDRQKAEFANAFQKNHFDVSLRRSRDELDASQKAQFRAIDDGFHENAGQAEDKHLMHLIYNCKQGDETGYTSFMCNCHLDWCIQLTPRNQYWGEQVAGEKPGTSISCIQRALYDVRLNKEHPCDGCQACYNPKPYHKDGDDIEQAFYCPAGAISPTTDGIAIDSKKCLSCLLCVRNCFRVRQSKDIALKVTPLTGHDDDIPATHATMLARRAQTAVEYNWTNFQYELDAK